MAQPTVSCEWQVSLDQGASWQSGSVTAPPSQGSVWVRAVTTVRVNGVPVVSGSMPNFTVAQIEGWSQTASATNDSVVGFSVITPTTTGAILPTPGPRSDLQSRRLGNLLIADRRNDTMPPGQGAGLLIQNVVGSVGQNPSLANPLAVFVMDVSLDGSAGDRVFSGAFVGMTYFGFVIPPGSVAVGNTSLVLSTWQAAPVTHVPVTLTVIPTPATTSLAVAGTLLALRRRRTA